MALGLCPPTPRRGLVLIDPSWEVRDDYQAIPTLVERVQRLWNVGIVAIWYPILADNRHLSMLARLVVIPGALCHEVRFPPARDGHGLVGSGMLVTNPPWRLEERAAWLTERFAALA